uniref:Chemokine interleukin-8-like domain-containing protein n=1 Tax=Amphilophus citrinellus TaxID=61819 RepID=A0A3Q0S088_AMPCI
MYNSCVRTPKNHIFVIITLLISYSNCSIGYVNEIKRNIVSYTMQQADGDCNITAVLYQEAKACVCANPRNNWVPMEMIRLNNRAAICKITQHTLTMTYTLGNYAH